MTAHDEAMKAAAKALQATTIKFVGTDGVFTFYVNDPMDDVSAANATANVIAAYLAHVRAQRPEAAEVVRDLQTRFDPRIIQPDETSRRAAALIDSLTAENARLTAEVTKRDRLLLEVLPDVRYEAETAANPGRRKRNKDLLARIVALTKEKADG